MSHITVMCISNDCESVMNALTGEIWDWVDYDNETGQTIGGVGIDEFLTIDDVRRAFEKNPEEVLMQIGAVVERGHYSDIDDMKQLKEVLDSHDGNTWLKLYDVHE